MRACMSGLYKSIKVGSGKIWEDKFFFLVIVFFRLHCTNIYLFLLTKLPLSNLDADSEEV